MTKEKRDGIIIGIIGTAIALKLWEMLDRLHYLEQTIYRMSSPFGS